MPGLEHLLNNKEATIIIKDFIKTYVSNSGCTGVVIGLSGGVDSATVAVLCKETLGKEKTHCLFLPDETTPADDRNHQKTLTETFDINCEHIDITPLIHQFSSFCLKHPDKLALANLKARIRMTLIFEYANMSKNLVCGTSNKSELLIGYFTKYGDGAADIQPIGDLYKTQVFALAQHLKIPKEIIKKPPTAGLWKGQTDEKELKMNYETLDKILYGLEQKLDVDDIAQQLQINPSDIQRIKQMRTHTQHKRRSPLIPKLGLRTIGIDWRSPVQEG
ncbi:MAG: NAD+ synthase [Euryarchaeota archaeon]|nr:NAD+ synthase [Euryarchaeota archaeon]